MQLYCNFPWVGSKIGTKPKFLNTSSFEILLKNIDFPKMKGGRGSTPSSFSESVWRRKLVEIWPCARCSWWWSFLVFVVLGAVCCSWRVLFLVLCVVRGAVFEVLGCVVVLVLCVALVVCCS